jgi:thioredoxin-like negative regulator of GroEL
MQYRNLSTLTLLGCLLMPLVLFAGCGQTRLKPQDTATQRVNSALFYGVNNVEPAVAQKLLAPVSTQKPIVLFFSSALCYDCKKMAPLIQALASEYTRLAFYKVDLLDTDQKNADILAAFSPKTAPTLLFLDEKRKTLDVLYNRQSEATIRKAIQKILP